MNIAIVTDSSADITPELAREHGIEIIPDLIMLGTETIVDGEGMSRAEFYQRLPGFTPPPTTAAPSPLVFQSVYERIARAGATSILSLHPSPRLSALHDIAVTAANAVSIPIRVFDSNTVTLGMGFQAIYAARLAAQGALVEEIVNCLESMRKRARLFAVLDTLEYVRRSGRVGWVTAALGNILGVKTLIEVRDGVVHRLGLSRTRRQAIEQLIGCLRKLGPLENLAVLHTSIHHQDEIHQILDSAPQVPETPQVLAITPVIGTHVGPKGLGFAAIQASA